ncbi:gluconokinase [Oscillospiraceae bacterium LTW-04]|nr:FGGY-family carbohydrate kinase [Oscillospiraceae bacterium MB24-C1]
MKVLVLEASTSSAKAMLFDSEQGILALKSENYPPKVGDSTVQNTEGVFYEMMKTGAEVAKDQKVDAVALSGIWHGLTVCDQKMQPLTPTYTWAYLGAAPTVNALRRDNAYVNSYYQKTGCMVHSIYPMFRLMQLKTEGLALSDRFVMGQGEYNFYRLTDGFYSTPSLMSGFGALDTHNRDYDGALLSEMGITRSQLPELSEYWQTRPLNKASAALLGVAQGIPVLPPFPDGALNQIGSGAMAEGEMTLSVGTSGALRMVTARPVIPDSPSTWCYMSPTGWLSGAATQGACNCVDWMKNKLFDSRYSYSELEEKAVDIKNLPVFLPFLFGERCPGWQDERLGGFHGVKAAHGREELFIATLEGVLMNLRHCSDVLTKITGQPKNIHVSGGILRSQVWLQMLADIFGQTLSCTDAEQASLLGGAALAMVSLKQTDDFNIMADYFKQQYVYPRAEFKSLYDGRYARYLECYSRCD